MTAYQITSMLEGAVQRGTGTAMKAVGKPIAGKTGTTNEEKDAWFIGLFPRPRRRHFILAMIARARWARRFDRRAMSAPIVRDFMQVALADKAAVPFRIPAGIKLVRINPRTGMRAGSGEGSILEAFKPGTSPPDSYSIIGYTDSQGRALTVIA